MRQENTEKQLIEQLTRISLPSPDPEFEHALRAQFIKKASRKRRSKQISKHFAWAGSISVVAILVFMIFQSDLLQRQDSAKHYSSDEGVGIAQFSISGVEKPQEVPNSESVDTSSTEADMLVQIADANLSEIHNYGDENRGDWRFYQNEVNNRIYASNNQKEAKLLYAVEEGYVNLHIHPDPAILNQYILIFIEGKKGGENRFQYYQMQKDGSLINIDEIPESGYTTAWIKWAPNGELALLQLDEVSNRSTLVGVIDPKQLSFTPLSGGLETAKGPFNEVGAVRISLTTWLDDQYILLFDNDAKSFRRIDSKQKESKTATVVPQDSDPLNGLALYGFGSDHLAILKTGNIRLDVGFEPSYRLHLVNMDMKNNRDVRTIMNIAPNLLVPDAPYEQNFLGVTKDRKAIISDIIAEEEYKLSLRVIDPVGGKQGWLLVWQQESSFPRAISNPVVAFSPDHQKLAIRLYSEQTETDADGNIAYTSAPYYLLVFDLETRRLVMTQETDSYEIPVWIDNQKLQHGESIIDLAKYFLQ